MIKSRMELYKKSKTELKCMLWKLSVPIVQDFKKKEYYIDKYLEAVNSDTKSLSLIMSENRHIY